MFSETLPTPETVEKLEKVIEYFQAEHRRLHMGFWGIAKSPEANMDLVHTSVFDQGGNLVDFNMRRSLARANPPCGTVCCLAGAAAILSGNLVPRFDDKHSFYTFDRAEEIASDWLGTQKGWRLFFVTNWPTDFRVELANCLPGTPEYLDVVVRRVRYFEQTGE